MSKTGMTLSALLGKVDEQAVRDALRDGSGETGTLAAFMSDSAAGAVAKEVNAALDKDLFEVMAGSIVMLKDLHQYTDPTKFPPERAFTHKLFKSTLQAPQDIDLAVLLAGVPGEITFVLTLDLNVVLESMTLTIKAGRITGVEFGSAKAQVGLRYKRINLVAPHETPPLKLARADFPEGQGLAIG
jgi:hypothetical protein